MALRPTVWTSLARSSSRANEELSVAATMKNAVQAHLAFVGAYALTLHLDGERVLPEIDLRVKRVRVASRKQDIPLGDGTLCSAFRRG